MRDIEVPEIGESISSGILAAWLKEDGEKVDEGEEIFELETDKATLGVPSPAAGVLHRSAAEGDEVEVGHVVGRIDTDAAGGDGASAGAANDKPAAGKDAAVVESEPQRSLSPAVRRVVAEHNLDPTRITGSGPNGRITKADAEQAAREGTAFAGQADAGASRGSTGESRSRAAGAETGAAARPPALGKPEMSTNERQRRVPLSNLRKRIAENLVSSKQQSAHVTTVNEVDMSEVMELRTRYKETFNEEHGVRLGFMSFFVKASQTALQAFPEVNAYLDGTDVLYNDYVNVGVALSSEKGLLTPVIKDVETKSFADIERQIVDFAERANNRRLKPDEMVGATFTISNGGIFGSMLSTPIPSPPQTAVLGMHSIQKRPVARNDEVVIRPMMYLALTYDHRMIDGREAVLFLGRIKELIEDPTRLLLGI